jgi:hypothetical protein
MNIDACRIKHCSQADIDESVFKNRHKDFNSNDGIRCVTHGIYHGDFRPPENYLPQKGRFPANVILAHLSNCICAGTKEVKGTLCANPSDCNTGTGVTGKWGTMQGHRGLRGYGTLEGKETIENWVCDPNCPVAILDKQSGTVSFGTKSYTYDRTYQVDGFIKSCVPQAPSNYGDIGGASRFFKQVKNDY